MSANTRTRAALAGGPIVLVMAGAAVTWWLGGKLPERVTHPIGVTAAIAVGAVVCFAGASKAVGARSWVRDAREMGVPRVVAALVPVLELVVGALLVVGVGWPVVPVVAGLILVAFSAFIVGQLAAGRRPRCSCFGAWSRAPLARTDVWRNAVLINLAILSLLR